jgi:hypothetical protein
MRFWPAREPVQADYERLREAALSGTTLLNPQARLFAQGGLFALISHPVPAQLYIASVAAMPRPAWTPYADPREETLAEVYRILIAPATPHSEREVAW